MNPNCKYGVDMTAGVEAYILCSAVNAPCYFQRYCALRERVIYTEGAETCKIMEENNAKDEKAVCENTDNVIEEIKVPETPEVKPPKKSKEKKRSAKCTVVLVTKTKVIYECEGKLCHKKGHFNVKVGDIIEI